MMMRSGQRGGEGAEDETTAFQQQQFANTQLNYGSLMQHISHHSPVESGSGLLPPPPPPLEPFPSFISQIWATLGMRYTLAWHGVRETPLPLIFRVTISWNDCPDHDSSPSLHQFPPLPLLLSSPCHSSLDPRWSWCQVMLVSHLKCS
jgi:hypothetical protein